MGIRLVVVDDNPHLAWGDAIYPANATFERFVAALLDVPGAPVASITTVVPIRDADVPPGSLPLDPRIRIVRSAPFDGIAGYLRHLPSLSRANRPTLSRAIAGADLLWLKVPASNAALAGAIATRAGVPRFVWVAGSAADVAGARYGGLAGLGARAIGLGYDAVGRAAAIGGDRVVVGRGFITSLVEPHEIRDPGDTWPAVRGRLRLVWAGRLVEGKGLEALLRAIGVHVSEATSPRIELTLVGDGPARASLEAIAADLGLEGHVRWEGYVADRRRYLDTLTAADIFVFPSEAEGFPKVVLDAMAVGLPILARPSGGLRPLVEAGKIAELIPGGEGLQRSLAMLGTTAIDLRARSVAFAVEHTRDAELEHLVDHWRLRWPELPW